MAAAMLSSRPHACADHRTNDEWTVRLAAKHVAQLGPLVKDHIPADTKEVHKHQLSHRAHSGGSCSHCCPNETSLGNRRIQYALAPKLLYQPLSDPQNAAPGIFSLKIGNTGSPCHILTQQHNPWIASHLQPQCFVDRLTIRELANCDCHSHHVLSLASLKKLAFLYRSIYRYLPLIYQLVLPH